MKNFSSYRPQGQIIDVKCEKSQLIGHFENFFSAIIELVREHVISNMHNKFGKDTRKTFKLSRPQVNVNADADAAELQFP